jgi:hypothetical protein
VVTDTVSTASFKKPIHNVKEEPDGHMPFGPEMPQRPRAVRQTGCLILEVIRNLVEPIGIEPMTSSLQS